jgi:hypothetical protein
VQNDTPVAEAELSADGRSAGKVRGKRSSSKPLTFLGVSQGPFAEATVEALHAAERLPKIATADYELRLLKVPAVYLAALWLHSATDDILIPMGNPPGGLKRNRPYSEKQVIKALERVAERTKQFHDAYEQKRKRPRTKKS